MLGNLMLPKSPENRRQAAQDPRYQAQHQAPTISQPKKLAAMTHAQRFTGFPKNYFEMNNNKKGHIQD
jgi:hypothetical protein